MSNYGELSNILNNNYKDLMLYFIKYLKDNNIKLYNEFSLQHELGIFLRFCFNDSDDYKIEFERNVKNINGYRKEYFENIYEKSEKYLKTRPKAEIDIFIKSKKNTNKQYAIELKFPRNGAYPREMHAFLHDIDFMYGVKKMGITTFCLTLVDSHLFYEGGYDCEKDQILNCFRGEKINDKIKIDLSTNETPNVYWNLVKADIVERKNDNRDEIRYYFIKI